MADDVILNSGSGGDTIAADDIGGIKHQRVKIQHGADGSATDVSSASPLPIDQGNVISSLNSRSKATLAASGTFQGVGEDVSKYGRVGVSITSSNATDGVLTMEVSRNNSDWGGPTRTWADTRFAQPHMWNIVEKYFRILYTNGTTEALDLEIQVQYSNNANILLGHQLDEVLLDESEAIITRSVAVGQDPNDVYLNAEQSGVDNDNSSIVNLTAGTSRVFTGDWHNVSGFIGITVLIDGTTGGSAVSGTLEMQFSHDGVTAHRIISVATADVRDTLPRTLGVVAKYFRIVYTSDADTASFQAQTMYHTQQVQLVSRADGTLQGSEDVTNVRAVLVGKTGGGSFVNIKSSNGGALAMDLADLDGNTIASGNGVSGTGVLRVSIANDSTGQVKLAAGTAGIGKLTANSGVDIGDVDVTSISAGSNLIGDVGLGVRTSGGTTIFRSIDLDEGALEVVKASAGQIYWLHVMNLATAVRFVKIYNATSGTIGTGTPVLTFPIPTQGDSNGAGFTLAIPNGIAFSTGISIGASTGVADNDTGAPGANEIIVNLGFA